MRIPGLVTVVAALAIGSVVAASVTSIEAPASVDREAYRLAPPFRPDQTGAERASSEIVDLVNEERARRGLPTLRPQELVGAAALAHAEDMAARRAMVHFGVDGSDTGDRLARAGFAWRTWGEAIGAGFATPELLVDSWMASDDQRSQILSENTYLGAGVAATPNGVPYWALIVAT